MMTNPFGETIKKEEVFYTKRQLLASFSPSMDILNRIQNIEDKSEYNKTLVKLNTVLNDSEYNLIIKLFGVEYKKDLKEVPSSFFIKHNILSLLMSALKKIEANRIFLLQ